MTIPALLRKLHYWGAPVIVVPIVVIIGTGLLLQLKKEIAWIQPAEVKTQARSFAITPDQILGAAMAEPALAVRSWSDITRIDVRPDRGLVKVSARNHWELQLHSVTGETLQVAYRRSDVIESLHDGSWFHDSAKFWIFLPAGVVLFGLWLTGMYLFVLPYWVRFRRRAPARAEARRDSEGA
jgi:uncharacterized iron-regulated membrane protein